LVPFIFWNIFTLLINALAQTIPATKIFFPLNYQLIANFSCFDYFNAVIGFNRLPIAYQFWFIRDLMILVLLVPFINLFLKIVPLPFLIAVFISWFLNLWPCHTLSPDATLFFCVGAYLALTKKNLFAVDKYGAMLVFPYMIIVTFNTFFIKQPLNPLLHKFGIILGVFVALFMTKYLVKTGSMKPLILSLSNANFFVFAVHEPLLTILKKVSYRVISPGSSALILLLYFVIPIIVVAFSVAAYRVLVAVMPRFASVVTGGRSRTHDDSIKTSSNNGARP
jgi:hypothetical protein